MHKSSSKMFFVIPELVALLAELLTSRDVARCRATCKGWAQYFEPCLWRRITPKHFNAMPHVLLKNRHYAHAVTIGSGGRRRRDPEKCLDILACDIPLIGYGSTASAEFISMACSLNLQSIKVPELASRAWLIFVKIVMQSCHLKQLQVPAPTLTRDPELLRSISSVLPRLRKLKIDGGDISMMQFLQIMDACTHHPQLIDLKCSFTVQDPRFHQEGPQHDDTLSLHRSGIRVFELPLMRRGYPGCLVLQILEHALPELERLSIVGRTIRERQWKKLTRTIQERCPKLKHFCCNFADEVPDPVLREAVAVIRGCAYQGLTSFKCLGHHVDRSTLGSKTNIVRALIDDHSATLEDFEMKDCADVSSADLQDMLATCSNLRRFWVEPGERGEAAAAAAALEYVDVLSRGWVCLELQELYLILDRNLSDDSPLSVPDSNDDLEEAVAAREVYAQIGRLVQLEVLCLGCNASDYATVDEEAFAQDLTLKNGWLSELKGLGQLQHFRMVTNFWSHMGQAEVEFMDTHWPRLRTITFEWLEAGDDITGAAHWRWLRKRRPGLQFEWSSFIPEPRLVRF